MSEGDRERWNARYAGADPPREPSSFLASLDGMLPRRGRALDVAGGSGRNALWLARRGLTVTLADVSDVALSTAARHAEALALPLETALVDVETSPLPAGPWDVILCFEFLHRPLFAPFARALAPGGWLVVCHPTSSNLQRHPHPTARYLLGDGELPTLVAGLDVASYEEGWSETGRHEARLVARAPGG